MWLVISIHSDLQSEYSMTENRTLSDSLFSELYRRVFGSHFDTLLVSSKHSATFEQSTLSDCLSNCIEEYGFESMNKIIKFTIWQKDICIY